MKKELIESLIQVHICNHERDDKESCGEKGAKDLTKDLKKWAKNEHPGEIKVYRAGCLGKCSQGIAVACYPEKKFWLNVKDRDEEDLKKELKKVLHQIKEK